ncbi:MAG: glycosyltransferase [Sideroxyarcus sp.]
MSVLFSLVKDLLFSKSKPDGINADKAKPLLKPMPLPISFYKSKEKIRFIVATRETKEDFFSRTAMGKYFSQYSLPFVELHLQDQNTLGLPVIYNRAIEASKVDPAILVFVHDDVNLCDFFWPDRIIDSLDHFQLVGLAGNKRRLPNQPSWVFIDTKLTWDSPENLSGVVGHGKGFPPANLSNFGAPCQEVKLLDGLMLIARSETLIKNGLRFDEDFAFHFYDLDICRQAEIKGIKMGTWSISAIHESGGNFGSPLWHAAYEKYLKKWGG